jgi:hypothetical protein
MGWGKMLAVVLQKVFPLSVQYCVQLRNKVHLWRPEIYQSESFIRSLELLSKLFYFMEVED